MSLSMSTLDIKTENILFQLPGICFWKDKDSIFHGMNKIGLESIGLSKQEDILGKSMHECCSSMEDADLYVFQDKRILNGGEVQFNLDLPTLHDGTKRAILTKKGPLLNEYNEIIGVIGLGYELNKDTYRNIMSLLTPLGLKFDNFINNETRKLDSYVYNNIEFTKRQAQILSYLLRGETAKLTAERLNLSHRTVEFYVEKIKEKLKCHTKLEIVNKAIEQGFIELMFLNIA